MDVHNLQEATALQVEQHHAADLAEQGKHGVKFLKYWFNESQGNGFCLVDAPSAEAAQLVHREAHGRIAERLIEVQPELVEAFLGGSETSPWSFQVVRATSETLQSGPFSSPTSSARRMKPWGTMRAWLCSASTMRLFGTP